MFLYFGFPSMLYATDQTSILYRNGYVLFDIYLSEHLCVFLASI